MMWHYFPRRPLENRVLKTRFIIQNFFKKLQVPSTASRIRSEQRETQIREGEKEIAWVAHLGRANPGHAPGSPEPCARPGFARPGSRNPGAQSGLREPKSRDPRDLFLSLSHLSISLSLIWSPSLWSDSLYDLIRSDPVRWGRAWDLEIFKIFLNYKSSL